MKIKMLKSFKYNSTTALIHSGTELQARVFRIGFLHPESYQVIEEGVHSGIEVPYSHCIVLPEEKTYTDAEYTKVHQELLQKREEVIFLMENKAKLTQKLSNTEEAYRRIFGKLASANTSINRYAIELYKEREDKALLLRTIEKEAAQKSVVLPRAAASQIKGLLNDDWNPTQILRQAVRREMMNLQNDAICEFANSDSGLEALAKALYNGYKVEQSPEEAAIDEVADLIQKWTNEPTFEEEAAECRNLAANIVGLMKGIKKN